MDKTHFCVFVLQSLAKNFRDSETSQIELRSTSTQTRGFWTNNVLPLPANLLSTAENLGEKGVHGVLPATLTTRVSLLCQSDSLTHVFLLCTLRRGRAAPLRPRLRGATQCFEHAYLTDHQKRDAHESVMFFVLRTTPSFRPSPKMPSTGTEINSGPTLTPHVSV